MSSLHEKELISLQKIIGEQLSSIEFVQDYVQFKFDGPVLSIFNPAIIRVKKENLSWGEIGFRDALCRLIGGQIESVNFSDEFSIELKFANGNEISFFLSQNYYSGPELIKFNFDSSHWWIL